MEVKDIFPSEGKEVEMVKLAYLATNGDPKTSKRSSRHGSNPGEYMKTVFETVIREGSLEPVREFVVGKLARFTEVPYSLQSYGEKWLQKAEFMTWIETMKYLNLNTAPLSKVEKTVKDKCCMDDLEEIKGAFMFNENLVMSAICDIMTIEQVKALWALFCKKKEEDENNENEKVEDGKDQNANQVTFEAPGMKELVFFYIIRYMVLRGKFNTLYTDRLLAYLEEIRPSVRNPEKLNHACEILERYEIMVQPAGYCLVFCVKEGREGADQEIDNIKSVFGERLGYKVNVIENPSKEDIEEEADHCSSVSSLSMFDSLVCWVLAHGDSEMIQLADREDITRKEFLKLFARETCFSKKPKLFFMATCQGDKSIPVNRSQAGLHMETDGRAAPVLGPILSDASYDLVNVHTESDRLVAYATMPNHVSFRSEETGSIFVSFICEQIAQLEKQPDSSINVVEILQRTARKMQSILFLNISSQGLGKQACYHESTLQKNFCFRLAGNLTD